jgi:hypothetical protein
MPESGIDVTIHEYYEKLITDEVRNELIFNDLLKALDQSRSSILLTDRTKGTLQQYAGRLHRQYETKQVVQVYDYVDIQVPMFMRMYNKRLKGYKDMGYSIRSEEN